MPSDSNGNYSLPNGYLATAGTTILPSEHNPPLEDIASSLTARLMRSGAGGMTGPLKLADGAVGLPGLTFATDPSSGFYKTAAGVGIAIGGTKVAEFVAGGVVGARVLGELVPYTGRGNTPPLFVYPVGQTLSRTGFPDMWAFAQNEIASGNIFYNNGDGSTTFGIGDMRGRVPAAMDSSGSVLTSFSMTPNGNTLGAIGGAQAVALSLGQLPTGIQSVQNAGFNVTVTSNAANVVTGTIAASSNGNGVGIQTLSGGSSGPITSIGTVAAGNVTTTSNNTGGSAHANVQPTMITNYILFVGA